MSISRRFILTFSGLTLGLFVVLISMRWIEAHAQIQQRNLFLTEQQTFLKHWLTADHQSLREETKGIANELSKNSFTESVTLLPHHDAAQIWELAPSGAITVHRPGNLHPDAVKLIGSPAFLNGSLRADGGWFYFRSKGAFYHATYSPIPNRENWLLLIRELDAGFLRKLSALMGGSATLQTLAEEDTPASGSPIPVP